MIVPEQLFMRLGGILFLISLQLIILLVISKRLTAIRKFDAYETLRYGRTDT